MQSGNAFPCHGSLTEDGPECGQIWTPQQGICSRAGNHRAVEPLRRLGLAATARIGLVDFNAPTQIDRFVDRPSRVAATSVATVR